MLETAVALVFAHALADFVLQTEGMVRDKHRPVVLLGHGAIVAGTAWAAIGFAPAAGPLAILALSHVLIDWIKLRYGGGGFRAFGTDQAAHALVIGALAYAWPGLWSAGLWPRLDPELLAVLPGAMAAGAGLVLTVWAGAHAVAALMRGIALPPDPEGDPSLPQGGRLVGLLERLVILVLVLAGQVVAIGLLIAAKSILRFGEVQKSRQAAEYVIIGTLASFAWALVLALATAWALERL